MSAPATRWFDPKIGSRRCITASERTARDVIYEARDFAHFENTFSAAIVTEYFRLLQQKTVFENHKDAYYQDCPMKW